MPFGLKEKAMLSKLEDLERELAALKMQAMGDGEAMEEAPDMEDMTEEPEMEGEDMAMDGEEEPVDEEAEALKSYMRDEREEGPKRPSGIMIAVGTSPGKSKPMGKPMMGKKAKKRGY